MADADTRAPAADPAVQDVRVAIIGTGFSGVGVAIRLKQAGIEDFVLLERADDLGGTWRDNHYPGLLLRRPLARVLVLVRAEPALDARVRAAVGDPPTICSGRPTSTA